MVRRTVERPVRAAPATTMCPPPARSRVIGSRACLAGTSTMPNGTGATSPPAWAGTAGSSSSVMESGSGGSHGLGCGPQPTLRAAPAMASTSTDRSVSIVPSSAAAASLISGSGLPSPCHGTGSTLIGALVTARLPGRLPPILEDCTPTGPDAPERT